MALTPINNQAFVREVDDEIRRDQAVALWKRYGKLAAIVIVIALIALAAFLFWRQHRENAAEAEAIKLQDSFDAWQRRQLPAATGGFQALSSSSIPGNRATALMAQGDLLLDRNDIKGAAAKFAQVAGDASLAQPFRDMALIRQTTAEYDALKPDVVVQRLKALAVPGNAWFGSAGELVAVAYIRQGKTALAGKLFGQIGKDEDVPPSIRQRAVQMATTLGADTVGADVKAK